MASLRDHATWCDTKQHQEPTDPALTTGGCASPVLATARTGMWIVEGEDEQAPGFVVDGDALKLGGVLTVDDLRAFVEHGRELLDAVEESRPVQVT